MKFLEADINWCYKWRKRGPKCFYLKIAKRIDSTQYCTGQWEGRQQRGPEGWVGQGRQMISNKWRPFSSVTCQLQTACKLHYVLTHRRDRLMKWQKKKKTSIPWIIKKQQILKTVLFYTEQSWLTMLLVSGVQQCDSVIHVSTHFQILFPFTEYWAEFPALYSRSLLVIYFKYSSMYMLIPNSYLSLPILSLW